MGVLAQATMVDIRIGNTVVWLPPSLTGSEDESTCAITYYVTKARIDDAQGKPYHMGVIAIGSVMNLDHISSINIHAIDEVVQSQKSDSLY